MIGIQSQREQIDGGVPDVGFQLLPIAHAGQRVQIRNEVERLLIVLQSDVLLDRSKVVAPMKPTGRLDTRKDSHDSPGKSSYERNRLMGGGRTGLTGHHP